MYLTPERGKKKIKTSFYLCSTVGLGVRFYFYFCCLPSPGHRVAALNRNRPKINQIGYIIGANDTGRKTSCHVSIIKGSSKHEYERVKDTILGEREKARKYLGLDKAARRWEDPPVNFIDFRINKINDPTHIITLPEVGKRLIFNQL